MPCSCWTQKSSRARTQSTWWAWGLDFGVTPHRHRMNRKNALILLTSNVAPMTWMPSDAPPCQPLTNLSVVVMFATAKDRVLALKSAQHRGLSLVSLPFQHGRLSSPLEDVSPPMAFTCYASGVPLCTSHCKDPNCLWMFQNQHSCEPLG